MSTRIRRTPTETAACDPDDDGDGILDGADRCPAAATDGFDADQNACRDTLPRFDAYVVSLALADSVSQTILRMANDASHLLCGTGNPAGAQHKLGDLRDFLTVQSGKRIAPETGTVLIEYVSNLINQIRAGRDVCQ